MQIETDSLLSDDPLWAALNECIARFVNDPDRVVYGKSPDDSRGFAVAEIKRLAEKAGWPSSRPVLDVRVEGPTSMESVDVFAPDGTKVEWLARSAVGMLGYPMPPLRRDQTVANLKAWRDLRQKEILGEAPGLKTEPKPDGPVEPNKFRYAGKEFPGLPPRQFQLVKELWKRRDRAASIDDLAEPVWGDREDPPTQSAAKSMVRRVNNFFCDNSLPLELSFSKISRTVSMKETSQKSR